MRTNMNSKSRLMKYNRLQKIVAAGVLLALMTFGSSASAIELFSILGGQRVGTSAMPFLKIPVGARAEAMGGAYVAVANDAFAAYWNPAGIAQIGQRWQGRYAYDPGRPAYGTKGPKTQMQQLYRGDRALGFQKNDWIADISYNALAYVQPLGMGSVSLNLYSLTMADMERTTEYHPDGTGEYFSYSDLLLGLTYALRMTDNFSWGVTLKYAREELAEYTMNNAMIDIGTYYWTGFRDLRIGVALVNFGPNSSPDGSYAGVDNDGNETEESFESYSPPTEFRLGGAMTLFATKRDRLLASVQLNHPVDNSENFKLGAEYAFMNMVFLRGGYKLNTDEEGLTLGGGVRVPWRSIAISVDYSYTDFGILNKAQRFSLGVNF